MVDALEFPGDRSDGKPDWDSLYLYRGSSVLEARPVFTGDVFFDVSTAWRHHLTLLRHCGAILPRPEGRGLPRTWSDE